MIRRSSNWAEPAARACRNVALGLIGGFCRRLGHDDIAARIAARPPSEQALIVAGALAALALTSLLFAQFGLIGLLAFLIVVIVLVN